MTDLDDALSDSSLVFHPADLTAKWFGGPPNHEQSTDPESIHNLGARMSGLYEVHHSFDDGLPDPVTMTNGNEASGVMKAELVGRNALIADVWGWRSGAGTASGTGQTSITVTTPAGVAEGDLMVVAITVNNLTAVVYDPDGLWTLLSVIDDSPHNTWIFTTRNWIGGAGDTLVCDQAVNYTSVCAAAWAKTADGTIVSMEAGTPVAIAETVSGTSHTSPVVELTQRGWILGVWSANVASGPWTAGAGSTELNEVVGATSDTMVSNTALLDQGRYTVTATTTGATAVATIQAIPIYMADRQAMDARSYFSPFNKKSPIYGYDRDTADTELTFNVVTASGVEGTVLHKGEMAGISNEGQEPKVDAVSKTRRALDKALTLPMVSGPRENCSVDWLATWLMARGGQYAGPGPGPNTIYWAPLYGSIHPHMGPEFGYNSYIYHQDGMTPSGPYGQKYPEVVPGPFVSAIFASQGDERTEQITMYPIRMIDSREEFPGVNPVFADQFSLASSAGRITFWLRGDPATAAPTYTTANYHFLFNYKLYLLGPGDVFLGIVEMQVRSGDRHLQVSMGSAAGGSGAVLFSTSLSVPLQTDGTWHFYGIAWDYAAGVVKVKKDGQEGTNNTWLTNGWNYTAGLSATDAAAYAKGDQIYQVVESHLPLADLQIESGAAAYSDGWTRHYPVPAEINATYRPTYQPLGAISEATPLQGWDTLSKLAQASLSHYRTNEEDNYEFLPLSYFGEPAQLTATMVADTEVNAGELAVTQDPSRTRNVVTVKYPDTKVDTNYGPVLSIKSGLEIPKGITVMTFPLDVPIAELHGQANPLSSAWDITHLSAAQLTTPSTIPNNIHYMTVNTAIEGNGTGAPFVNSLIQGKILSVTSSTVTVQFTNKNTGSGKLFLANNADGVDFLRILGYAVRITDGWVTDRDSGSVTSRRERPLEVELEWIHDRSTAQMVAGWLVTALARPRAQVTVEVMGDPRRKPGMLVELLDAEGTQAEGTWRILGIKHNADGPKFTQTLSLVAVLPIGVWDELPGWDETIWSE